MALVLSFAMSVGFIRPAEAGLWPFASKKHIKQQIDPLTGRGRIGGNQPAARGENQRHGRKGTSWN
jgi:hypothetical protein